jgi:hypothetical protein
LFLSLLRQPPKLIRAPTNEIFFQNGHTHYIYQLQQPSKTLVCLFMSIRKILDLKFMKIFVILIFKGLHNFMLVKLTYSWRNILGKKTGIIYVYRWSKSKRQEIILISLYYLNIAPLSFVQTVNRTKYEIIFTVCSIKFSGWIGFSQCKNRLLF